MGDLDFGDWRASSQQQKWAEKQSGVAGKLSNFIVKIGLAKNAKQASYIIVFLIALLVIASFFVLSTRKDNSQAPMPSVEDLYIDTPPPSLN